MNIEDEIKTTQKIIDNLFNQIEEEKVRLGQLLEKTFQEEGYDAFGKLWSPEYYGIAEILINDECYYYIPSNPDFNFELDDYYRGRWISSSQTC